MKTILIKSALAATFSLIATPAQSPTAPKPADTTYYPNQVAPIPNNVSIDGFFNAFPR